jgi:hypothetical protein
MTHPGKIVAVLMALLAAGFVIGGNSTVGAVCGLASFLSFACAD